MLWNSCYHNFDNISKKLKDEGRDNMFFNKYRAVGRIYIQAKTPQVSQEALKKLGWIATSVG